MQALTSEQTALLAAIRRARADAYFDATYLYNEAEADPELAAAIKAAVPEYKQKRRRTHTQIIALRKLLTALAEQHFTTDRQGWWYLKEEGGTPHD
jgi:hypothetical protein